MKQAKSDFEVNPRVWQISFCHGIRLHRRSKASSRASTDVLAYADATPDPECWEGLVLGRYVCRK